MRWGSSAAMRLVGALLLALAIGSPASAAASTDWRWPLAGVPAVLRPFQPPPTPYAAGHRGVDLAAPAGAAVLAAGRGVIGFAGLVAGRGVVTVVHGPLRTTYEPVSAAVHVGQQVAAGEPIGQLQPPTGHCGGGRPCLHWGLLRGSVYLDPLALLGLAHSVLLPMWGPRPLGGGAVTVGAAGFGPQDQPAAADNGRRPAATGPSWPAVAGAVLLGATGVVLGARRRPFRPTGYD